MKTELLPADEPGIRVAAEALQRGLLVAFPTDTVYGLGAHPFLPEAVARIYEVKGRPEEKPIALLVAGLRDVEQVASSLPPAAGRLAEVFWPGALTIVVPARAEVPAVVRGGGLTVGVRAPDHRVVRELVRWLGVPVATTSANLSGRPSPTTTAEVLCQLGDRIDYVIEGTCPGGVASTVVDFSADPPRIVREGAISKQAIEAALGRPLEEAR
ncbi:MAG: L-threonylcarbamoyladenylate synthase [Chloroflexota bacterium]